MLFFSGKLKRAKRRRNLRVHFVTVRVPARVPSKARSRRPVCGFRYCAVYPPSTMMSWPVMNAAPGELSQSTALAISSGVHTSLPPCLWSGGLRGESRPRLPWRPRTGPRDAPTGCTPSAKPIYRHRLRGHCQRSSLAGVRQVSDHEGRVSLYHVHNRVELNGVGQVVDEVR
jgi:hypothetical protein